MVTSVYLNSETGYGAGYGVTWDWACLKNVITLPRWWWISVISWETGLHTFLLILCNWITCNLLVGVLCICADLDRSKHTQEIKEDGF